MPIQAILIRCAERRFLNLDQAYSRVHPGSDRRIVGQRRGPRTLRHTRRGTARFVGLSPAEDSGTNGAARTLLPATLGGGRRAARPVGVACGGLACFVAGRGGQAGSGEEMLPVWGSMRVRYGLRIPKVPLAGPLFRGVSCLKACRAPELGSGKRRVRLEGFEPPPEQIRSLRLYPLRCQRSPRARYRTARVSNPNPLNADSSHPSIHRPAAASVAIVREAHQKQTPLATSVAALRVIFRRRRHLISFSRRRSSSFQPVSSNNPLSRPRW